MALLPELPNLSPPIIYPPPSALNRSPVRSSRAGLLSFQPQIGLATASIPDRSERATSGSGSLVGREDDAGSAAS